MKHLSVLTSCGCVGNVTDGDEEQKISTMLALSTSDDAEDNGDDQNDDDDDEGGELVTNAEELRQISMMLGLDDNNASKP